MERNQLDISQWSCEACAKIFHYANDEDDTIYPAFCPECGRKNLRKM
jgi:rRNA maturation endonuclease Nob1